MKSFLGILLALVLLLSLLAIGLPSPVLAVLPSEVWVDDTGPSCPDTGSGTQADPYCRIQDGINGVLSPGTVHVAAGTYYENIGLRDGVEVLGAGAGITTINGGGSRVVVIPSNAGSTTKLDGFTITNGSHTWGGGIYLYDNSSPTISNCIFSGNSATSSGGGMYNYIWSSPTVTNCDFSGNSATSGSGGGMYNYWFSSPPISNNIIVGNTALAGGGIAADSTCSPTIDYNDVWNNSPNDYSGCSAGPHNISQDPLFVNPAMGDYHPQSSSPCIDAGTNVGAPTGDMEGKPRPIDGDGDGTATTDMGAYEYMPPPPPYFRYLHSKGSLIDIADPVSTQWHEIWPFLYRHYHLSSREDNGDGILSRCDHIGLDEKPDGEARCYHVENVTITLFVTHNETGEAKYIELEGGYNTSVLMNPVCTQWHEICPVFCRQYHLSNWADTGNMTGTLDYCDYVELTNNANGRVTWWHVEDVATDIIVTIKAPPVGGDAYLVSKISLLAPWIAGGMLLAGSISWYVLRRRRAGS